MNDYDVVLRALAEAQFIYPVAIYSGSAPEVGAVLDVHAFDVPEEDAVRVSFEITKIVRATRLEAVPLVGCYDTVESDEQRRRLPAQVWWFRPRPLQLTSIGAPGVIEIVARSLDQERFPYAVAMCGGHALGEGQLVEVQAFPNLESLWAGEGWLGFRARQVSFVSEPHVVYRGAACSRVGVSLSLAWLEWLHQEVCVPDFVVNTHYSLAS